MTWGEKTCFWVGQFTPSKDSLGTSPHKIPETSHDGRCLSDLFQIGRDIRDTVLAFTVPAFLQVAAF